MIRSPALPLLVLGLFAGCGDGTGPPDGDVPPDLVGTWVADPTCLPACSFTVFSRQNPADSINFVRFGLGVEMVIQSTGRLRMEVSLVRDTLLHGTVRVRGGQMLVSAQGSSTVDTLDYTLAPPLLHIELRSRLEHDLDGDGTEEPVGLRGTFRKGS